MLLVENDVKSAYVWTLNEARTRSQVDKLSHMVTENYHKYSSSQ